MTINELWEKVNNQEMDELVDKQNNKQYIIKWTTRDKDKGFIYAERYYDEKTNCTGDFFVYDKRIKFIIQEDGDNIEIYKMV